MISLEDLNKCKMRQVLHMDGPRDRKRGWWADIAECVEHPRLRRKATYTRVDGGVKVAWQVDGGDWLETLEAALVLLNGPVQPPTDPQFIALQEMRDRLRDRE